MFNYYSQATDYIRETELSDPDALLQTENYIQVTQQVTLSDGGYTLLDDVRQQLRERARAGTAFLRTREGSSHDLVAFHLPMMRGVSPTVRVPLRYESPRYRDFACGGTSGVLNASPQAQDYDITDCEQPSISVQSIWFLSR